MRRSRFPLGAALAVWTFGGLAGCTHNHYYTMAPGMPATVTTSGAYGSICDVPQAGETIVTGPVSSTPVVVSGRPSRVVVSQPKSGVGRSGRMAWSRTEPDAMPITRTEGALSEETLNR